MNKKDRNPQPLLSKFSSCLVILLTIILFGFAICMMTTTEGAIKWQNFVYQADAFIHGQLNYRILPPSLIDSVEIDGKFYWPLGPFSALILMPLVAIFGPHLIIQNLVQIILNLLVFFFCYSLAKKWRYNTNDSLWLAFAFTLCSAYVGNVYTPTVWPFSSVVTVVLLFLTINEYLNKQRFWLLGIFIGAVLATRFTAGLIIILISGDVILDKTIILRNKIKKLAALMVPIFISGLLLLLFNWQAYGHPLDNGYMKTITWPAGENTRKEHGLFNPALIPNNLYYFFLVAPTPTLDPHTLKLVPPYIKHTYAENFFLLSPIFLIIFFNVKLKNRFFKLTVLTCLLILTTLLTYYSANYYEFGPRYLTDLLPLVYLLLLESFPNYQLQFRHRLIIAASGIFNLYLFLTWILKP